MKNDNPNKNFKNPDKSTSSESLLDMGKRLHKKFENMHSTIGKLREINKIDVETAKRSLDVFSKYYYNSKLPTLVWDKKLAHWVPATEDESGRPVEPNYNEDRDDR